ncbi:MAG: putative rane protein [Ramlibacter sp.]|nr:putative rane protein [Ramlibacter sp.]
MGASQPLPLRAAVQWPERLYQGLLTLALAVLGFFVLYSPAGVSMAMAALALLAFAAPMRLWRQQPWREPVLVLGLLLLAYILLRTLIGEGAAALPVVNKYQELLLVPVLWALLRVARRPQAFAIGLLLGAFLLAALYWTGMPKETKLGHWLVLHRISAGFGLAVCSFLLFEHARLGRIPKRAGYLASFFLAATVLAAVNARTGHVVLLVLVGCAGFRAAPPRARIITALAVLVSALVVAAVSPTVRGRVLETLNDSEAGSRGQAVKESSTQQRLEIWDNAVTVAREHWLLGTGWGHYLPAVKEVSARRHPDPAAVPGALSENPHNEYLMQLGGGGVPALLLFLLWLAWPMARALRDAGTGKPWSSAVGCIALAFAVGCLFNSMLLDFIEAHFYGSLLAWLLVRRVED